MTYTFLLFQSQVTQSETSYSLTGVVVHLGTGMRSGHYIAFVKMHGVWFLYDDDEIQVCVFHDSNVWFLFSPLLLVAPIPGCDICWSDTMLWRSCGTSFLNWILTILCSTRMRRVHCIFLLRFRYTFLNKIVLQTFVRVCFDHTYVCQTTVRQLRGHEIHHKRWKNASTCQDELDDRFVSLASARV